MIQYWIVDSWLRYNGLVLKIYDTRRVILDWKLDLYSTEVDLVLGLVRLGFLFYHINQNFCEEGKN